MKKESRSRHRARKTADPDRKARWDAYRTVHAAFLAGDLEALKATLGQPPEFPNGLVPMERAIGNTCLGYAIAWSPLAFIATLLKLGADPNFPDPGGFPPLFAALSSERPDKHDVLTLLLASGADIGQRGINDYTPLHYAVDRDDPASVAFLIAQGANPDARTRIDDRETPLELAQRCAAAKGRGAALRVLRKLLKL